MVMSDNNECDGQKCNQGICLCCEGRRFGAEGVVTSKAPAVKAAAAKGVAMTNVLGELPSWH